MTRNFIFRAGQTSHGWRVCSTVSPFHHCEGITRTELRLDYLSQGETAPVMALRMANHGVIKRRESGIIELPRSLPRSYRICGHQVLLSSAFS